MWIKLYGDVGVATWHTGVPYLTSIDVKATIASKARWARTMGVWGKPSPPTR